MSQPPELSDQLLLIKRIPRRSPVGGVFSASPMSSPGRPVYGRSALPRVIYGGPFGLTAMGVGAIREGRAAVQNLDNLHVKVM